LKTAVRGFAIFELLLASMIAAIVISAALEAYRRILSLEQQEALLEKG